MPLSRGLSADGASTYIWVGGHHGVPSQETGGSESAFGGKFFDLSPTQHSNVCHRIAKADTLRF